MGAGGVASSRVALKANLTLRSPASRAAGSASGCESGTKEQSDVAGSMVGETRSGLLCASCGKRARTSASCPYLGCAKPGGKAGVGGERGAAGGLTAAALWVAAGVGAARRRSVGGELCISFSMIFSFVLLTCIPNGALLRTY